MKNIFKKKNPIKIIRKKIKEHLFYKDKRFVFDANVDIVYDNSEFKDRNRLVYYEYGEAVEDIFKPNSMIDIGCANGYLLEYFYKKGIKELAGLEGAKAAFKYMSDGIKEKIFKTDLSQKVDVLVNKKFYLVNCTEVGEHIPAKYENIFLKNIERFVDKYIILSWANTWEDWLGFDRQKHVNPRSKRYIRNRLKRMGLRYNRFLTNNLVRALKKKQNVFDHWIKNIMVFEKKASL
jgi:hypothetical protein